MPEVFQIPTPVRWINDDGSPTIAFFKFITNLYNSGFGAGIPTNTIASNLQAGTASPIGNTLTEILDAIIGTSRGSLLVRGALQWEDLPVGNDGEVLVSDGTDPVYEFLDALASTVTLQSGAPATITTAGGDLLLDSATHILQLGTTSSAAGTPGSFSAARYLPIKDGSGTTYYIPLGTTTW